MESLVGLGNEASSVWVVIEIGLQAHKIKGAMTL